MKRLYPRIHAALLQTCAPAEATQLLLSARRGDRLALIKIRAAVQLTRSLARMRFAVEDLLDYERTIR